MKSPHALLTMSIFSSDFKQIEKAMQYISMNIASIHDHTKPFDFDPKQYYAKEMGSPLVKVFCILDKLMSLENVLQLKLDTNALEQKFSSENNSENRIVNIDPGFIDLYRFSLLSTKNAPHRIYLGQGIWQENTLLFHDNQWNPHRFTYPDYQRPDVQEMLHKGRELYKLKMKHL